MEEFLLKNKLLARLLTAVEVSWVVDSGKSHRTMVAMFGLLKSNGIRLSRIQNY